MANIIKIKNSSVAAKVPLTGDLAYGEIALNYADGKIYYKKSDNTIQSISGGVASVSGTAPIVSSGGATPAISIPVATTSVSGYLSSTDWTTFNGKQPAGSYLTAEADTLATVTARGATTTVVPTFSNGATVNGPLIVGWNIGGAYPVSGGYGILSWNFSSGSGETNFWNGYTPANVSFTWLQKTGTSAATNLMQLSPTGFLTTTGGATINGNTVIAVTDNTNAALRITQLGTGNALLVEDSTNPDATPFVVNADGRVIVGSTTVSSWAPDSGNHSVQTKGDGTFSNILMTRSQDSVGAPSLLLAKSRGSQSSPTSVINGDNTGFLNFYGYDGLNSIISAQIGAQVDAVPGTNDMPGRLVFSTTADGVSSITERMRIDSSGNVGIGTTSPTYKLDISGANLGTTAGNQSNIARLFSVSGNADYLEITNTRTTNGGDWTTAGFRFQQKIDATWQAWQQFNGGADYGITWGTGGSSTSAISIPEKMRLDSAGRLSIGTVSSGSMLTVAGQIESTVTGYKFPDGTVQASAASGGGAWTKITTTTTATTKKQYVTDTTAGAFTVTLPASPAAGDYVYFMDAGNWATNNLTVARNGSTIEASATDLVLDVRGLMIQLIYDGTTWQVMSNIGPQGPVGPAQGVGKVIAMAMIFGG